jgi:hypothetical protein
MPRLTVAASAGREQRCRGGQPQQHHGREQGAQHAVPARCDQRRTERRARAALTPRGAGRVLMGRERVTAPARPRGHAAALASNDVASSSVNPRTPRRSCGSGVRLRSALCSRQRAACTVAARSGRRYRFVVMRLVLSWRPVARARHGQKVGASPPPGQSVHQRQGFPRSPVSPRPGSGRRAVPWPW